ncbi:hypothetical protein KA025_00790 [Candidatus Saccharibacteria bacterium]|nr:hypothetical protein [Candidatus Saccharibacteria bacterium]MBP7834603.1 hypothetical protein [Candidatus Saccharibacteria bacterium]
MAEGRKSRTLLWVVIVLLVISLGVGAYLWRDNQAKTEQNKNLQAISELQKQLADVNKKLESQTGSGSTSKQTSTQPTAQALASIQSAITTGNTAALEGYMANTVVVVIAASEGMGERTPAQAISDLNYLSNANGPWNFSLDATTITKYQNGEYKTYFKPNTLVGKSANGYVVAFNFDSAGKINGIFMAVNSSLLE